MQLLTTLLQKNHSMSTKKVIITAPVHECLPAALEEKGYSVLMAPQISYAELNDLVAVAEADPP